jgi:ubiquinone/menaquinone biosynthesis C-methylase UbiE
MPVLSKDWDRYVVEAEEVARGDGFRALRDRIIALSAPQPGETAVDVGAGTGLLTLPLAELVARVWAIDISAPMCEYLRTKASSAGHENVEVAVASATSLPLVDASADLVVSNYCFHHLSNEDKLRALDEVARVLRPGGRLVFGDMMFQVSLGDERDRKVVAAKVRGMVRKGPAGMARLAKNALRFAGRRWEQPARARWWEDALRRAGFADVETAVLDHEGGIASAQRP